jgi:hypothetical protein
LDRTDHPVEQVESKQKRWVGNESDLEFALDGVGGVQDCAGRLLPQHVAAGHSAGRGGGLDAVGGVGLAVAELGEGQLRRGPGEAGDVGGGVAQQRRLVERVRRVHRPQQLGGPLRHRSPGGGSRVG